MTLPQFRGDFLKLNPRLAQWSDQLEQRLQSLEQQVGGVPAGFVDDPSQVNQGVVPPPAASFSVTGIDGKFIVLVSNPETVIPQSVLQSRLRFQAGTNLRGTAILHNLQSATDLNFNQSSNLKDYGTSSQLLWTDQDPNVTRFFRLRSSFDGVTWNAWQIFSSTITCGPEGVWSGILRSAALTQVNASATPTTKPLTAATGVAPNNATISIAAFQVQYPNSVSPATNGLVSYNSGAVTGLLDSTMYFVYCLDPKYAGGAQTYLATTDQTLITSQDYLVYLGNITTPAHGGGGTSGGGGGTGPPGGNCFTGNTLVITRDGLKPIAAVIAKQDRVLTQRGWRTVRTLREHCDFSGPMCDMGHDELVTFPHRFWWRLGWVRADLLFLELPRRHFKGSVFNLEVEGDGSDEEQCYVLANGWIPHNFQKI